jgi:hypothetical protein
MKTSHLGSRIQNKCKGIQQRYVLPVLEELQFHRSNNVHKQWISLLGHVNDQQYQEYDATSKEWLNSKYQIKQQLIHKTFQETP